ncbi:hypothetical protein [Carp edema virus]|nr:hypothetical protein [Carp edema virus]
MKTDCEIFITAVSHKENRCMKFINRVWNGTGKNDRLRPEETITVRQLVFAVIIAFGIAGVMILIGSIVEQCHQKNIKVENPKPMITKVFVGDIVITHNGIRIEPENIARSNSSNIDFPNNSTTTSTYKNTTVEQIDSDNS